MRGRTVVGPRGIFAAPIRDGAYTLDVPFPSATWYVVVEEPGHPLTQVGPIAVALNEKQTLDIACTEGGRIRGRVKDVPPGWEGNLWVVAFSKTAVREEARVAPDGTFLPPAAATRRVRPEGRPRRLRGCRGVSRITLPTITPRRSRRWPTRGSGRRW